MYEGGGFQTCILFFWKKNCFLFFPRFWLTFVIMLWLQCKRKVCYFFFQIKKKKCVMSFSFQIFLHNIIKNHFLKKKFRKRCFPSFEANCASSLNCTCFRFHNRLVLLYVENISIYLLYYKRRCPFVSILWSRLILIHST